MEYSSANSESVRAEVEDGVGSLTSRLKEQAPTLLLKFLLHPATAP